MRLKPLGIRTVIISFALVTGILLGTLGLGYAIAIDKQDPPDYSKNENGQTYGSIMYATTPDTYPDLILAYGEDGNLGYVRSVDLIGETPKTPQEALSRQRSMAGKARQVPLYDVDGKTIIGVFNIENGDVIEISEKNISEDKSAEEKN